LESQHSDSNAKRPREGETATKKRKVTENSAEDEVDLLLAAMDAESPSSPANKNQTSKANNSTDPSEPTSSPKRKSAQRKLPFTPPRSTTDNTTSPQKSPRKSRSKKARAQQAQENFNSDQWISSRRRTETAPNNTSAPAQLPLPAENSKSPNDEIILEINCFLTESQQNCIVDTMLTL
jgi:hypothetical protein